VISEADPRSYNRWCDFPGDEVWTSSGPLMFRSYFQHATLQFLSHYPPQAPFFAEFAFSAWNENKLITGFGLRVGPSVGPFLSRFFSLLSSLTSLLRLQPGPLPLFKIFPPLSHVLDQERLPFSSVDLILVLVDASVLE